MLHSRNPLRTVPQHHFSFLLSSTIFRLRICCPSSVNSFFDCKFPFKSKTAQLCW